MNAERQFEIPVVSFVAMSGTGKTTLIEKVIPELKVMGLRLAVVKHDVHGFEMDHPGKDTWRFSQAGADMVVISSHDKFALIEKPVKEYNLRDIISKIHDVDLIIVEGYKKERKATILVIRSDEGIKEASDIQIDIPSEDLLAVASNIPADYGIPCYDLNDAAGIAREIVKYINKR
jgi:molybdopterin-guanine dinucleotide biosynthesis protein MobB